jgi:hypothetical protein
MSLIYQIVLLLYFLLSLIHILLESQQTFLYTHSILHTSVSFFVWLVLYTIITIYHITKSRVMLIQICLIILCCYLILILS